VPLKRVSIIEPVDGACARIPNGKIVRAIYGALTKPPAPGAKPEGVERVKSDEDLENFLAVADGVYSPLRFQVQLARADRAHESPPPDDRAYSADDEFVTIEDPYDPNVRFRERAVHLFEENGDFSKADAW